LSPRKRVRSGIPPKAIREEIPREIEQVLVLRDTHCFHLNEIRGMLDRGDAIRHVKPECTATSVSRDDGGCFSGGGGGGGVGGGGELQGKRGISEVDVERKGLVNRIQPICKRLIDVQGSKSPDGRIRRHSRRNKRNRQHHRQTKDRHARTRGHDR